MCKSPSLPRDLEECLLPVRGQHRDVVLAHIAALPYSEWQVSFGHPTLALIHFFKRQDINYPNTSNINSDIEANHFIRMFYSVMLFTDLYRSKHITLPDHDLDGGWTCPCKTGEKCGPLARALKARLSTMQLAIELLKFNAMPLLINHAFAHLDAHMPLLCAIASLQTQLPAGDYACSERHMMRLVEHAPIDLQWAYTEDSVPDTSPLLLLSISYNNYTKGVSNKRVFQSKFPHLNNINIIRIHKLVNFIYKGLPNRCNNRELWKFMYSCCISSKSKKNTGSKRKKNAAETMEFEGAEDLDIVFEVDVDLVEFFAKLFIASILGIYRGSREKMSDINSRTHMYNLMYSPVPIDEIVGIMNPENKITLLYIAKEYVRAMTDRSPGVLEGLKKIYDWDIYDRHIDEITSIVRTIVQTNMTSKADVMTSLNDIFNGADSRIPAIHNISRRSQREKMVNYDVYAIMKSCKDMNLKAYVARDNDNGEFTGKEYMMESPHPALSMDLTTLMRQLIHTFPSHHWVPLDWLVCFGAKRADILAIRTELFRKMTGLMKLLDTMRKRDPYSYAIFYTFFRLCKEHRDYREYYADAHMYLAHAQALNHTHGVIPNGHIPKVLGKLQVCPTCGDFKRPLVLPPAQAQQERRRRRHHARLPRRADSVRAQDQARKLARQGERQPQAAHHAPRVRPVEFGLGFGLGFGQRPNPTKWEEHARRGWA